MRVARWLCVLLLIPVFMAGESPVEARPKVGPGDLAWHWPETAILKLVRTEPHKEMNRRGCAESYTLLGGDVEPDGQLEAPANSRFPFSDRLLQIAARVSLKPAKKGRSWSVNFESSVDDSTSWTFPDELAVEYQVQQVESGLVGIEITGTGSDEVAARRDYRNPRWVDYTLKMQVVFNVEEGWLESFKGSATGMHEGETKMDSEFAFALGFAARFNEREDLDKAVNPAIDRGIKELRTRMSMWSETAGDASLVAYTLLQCGMKPDDAVVLTALSKMYDNGKFAHTYQAALVIMALEAKYVTEQERMLIAAGTPPQAFTRNLSELDRGRMQHALDFISDNIVPGDLPVWSYHKEIGIRQLPDLSNTQFAALGLAAAQRCELEIPAGMVRNTGSAILKFRTQETGEPQKVKRVTGRDKKGAWSRKSSAEEARGFGYQEVPAGSFGGASGSMTCAGVCSLLLVADIVENMPDERRKAEFPDGDEKSWRKQMQDAIEGGLAWLELKFTVTHNTGRNLTPDFHYFYLYSLERVGAFAHTEYIGEHEWYAEGAMYLVAAQNDTGSWRDDVHDTCFALLFLRRATIPTRTNVLTGK